MTTFKRFLSMVLAMAMVFSMIPTAFAAADTEISMGSAQVDLTEGNTVTVPVKIEGNTGFAGMDLSISIPDGWSITEIETRTMSEYSIFFAADKYGSMSLQATPQINTNHNGIGKFVISAATKNFTEDGTLFWVTYQVPADAMNGEYAVEASAVKINTLEDTKTNIAEDMTFTAGTVTVTGGVSAEPVGEAEISMGDAEVDLTEGNTVTVPVKIEGNTGFAGMDLSISIPDGWSITEIETRTMSEYSIFFAADKYGSMSLQATPQINTNSNGVGKFVISSGTQNFTEDGTLFWVTYQVPAEAMNGEYAVETSAVKINTLEDTKTNIAEDMTFTAGTITVTGGMSSEPQEETKIVVGHAQVDLTEGNTVTVPVEIKNNTGFAGMDLSISIPDGWSITEIETRTMSAYSIFFAADKYGSMSLQATPQINTNSNGVGKFVISSGTQNFTEDGVLFWVTYQIPEGTATGEYDVEVSAVKINTLEDTKTNIAEDMVFESGVITVEGAAVTTGTVHATVSGVEANDTVIIKLYDSYPNSIIATAKIVGNNEWYFEDVEAGYYAITAECEGYEIGYFSMAVYVDEVNEIEFEMIKKVSKGSITGSIGGAATTESVTITLYDQNGVSVASKNFNMGDTYYFDDIAPSTYRLVATCSGYTDVDMNVAVTVVGSHIDIFMEKAILYYYIKGTVNGPAETETVTVRLLDAKQSKIDEMTVNGGGTYKFYDLLPGTYYIDASCAGYNDYLKEVIVTNDNYYLDFIMEKKAPVVTGDYIATLEPAVLLDRPEEKTVVMTVMAKDTIAVDAMGMTVMIPEGWTLKAIENEVLGFTASNVNLANGKVNYVTADAENWPTQLIAKVTYNVPANTPVGTYELGIEDLVLSADYGEVWEEEGTAMAELEIIHVHEFVPGAYHWEGTTECTVIGTCYCGGTAQANAVVTSEITLKPTCVTMGQTTYTATFDEAWAETQVKTLTDIPESGHTEGAAVEENRVEATCMAAGSYESVVYCTVCTEELSRETVEIPVNAEAHKYEGAVCVYNNAHINPDYVFEVTTSKGAIEYERVYTAEGAVVKVDCEMTCKVGYLVDGKYVKISGTKNADGTYNFVLPDGVQSVFVTMVGDTNGDGKFNSGDAGRLNAGLLGKVTLTAEQMFAADVNGDGKFNSGDAGRLNAVALGKTTFAW